MSDRFSIKRVIEKEYDGLCLRDFLFTELNFSHRLIKRVKEPGQLLINGEKKTVRYLLKCGDVLEVIFQKEEKSNTVIPEEMPLSIVYEDEHILVVEKASGIPTIPSRLHPTGTLVNAIAYYYERNKIPFTIHIVTRLDKDTSGLVLIAKHQYSHSLLSDLQKANKIERIYRAVVHGVPYDKKGKIDVPIGRDPQSIIKRMVRSDGKRAVTHYKVLEEMSEYSDVKVWLETGRTHQIRVHFSYLNHPLAGDDLYGGKTGKIKRQALHCSEIKFIHPFTKSLIHLFSEIPDDMALLV